MKRLTWTGESIIYEGDEITIFGSLERFLEFIGIEKDVEYEVSCNEEIENSKRMDVRDYSSYKLILCNPSSAEVVYICKSAIRDIFGFNIKSLYYRKYEEVIT